jgi:hypothetical protein
MDWEEQPSIRKNKQNSEKVTLFFPTVRAESAKGAQWGVFGKWHRYDMFERFLTIRIGEAA